MSASWRSWLSEDAAAAIRLAAERAHPNETGGVLVGVHSAGRPWITQAIELTTSHPRPRFYEPPKGSRQAAVRRAARHDRRLGYLGEWHSHPIDVPPSLTDIDTVKLLAATGDCPRPVLLIARRTANGYALDARQWSGRSLRQLRVVCAGPLPTGERPAGGTRLTRRSHA
ncbi:Mov34/MPN/PAD-1 family protein [Miltoncostaea marina]|uniref:Mov34/MPN/PAD-1 family protein n=1 Tax=Miltoncostaea marina TaxID=2843215 RepID=UPI001C3C86C3|nr:Mov34/MPN/PAD-1 family protein [Miltoncostaea marina]